MSVYVVANRVVMLGVLAGVAVASRRFGAGVTLGTWAGAMGVICVVVGWLLTKQPVGRMGVVNRIAGVVIPWGYRVGRGKLWPAVGISWGMWVLLGWAVVAYARPGGAVMTAVATTSVAVMRWLVVAWVIDGAALLYVVRVVLKNGNPGYFFKRLAGVMGVLVAMIGVSAALVATTDAAWAGRLALLIAGGPVALGAAAFGLFVLVMLTFGRKARWN